MKIQPFGERITIKVIKEDEVTLGGLITVVSNESSNKGKVEALGEEVKDYIKVGDVVMFPPNAGTSYSDGSGDYKVLNVREVIGKVVNE